MEYKTIAAPCEAKFIEKKSEFIGYLCPVQTEEQAIAFIEQIRAMRRKATHNCYAYILRENNYKLSGILNGIDYKYYNPLYDRTIANCPSLTEEYSPAPNTRFLKRLVK